MFLASAVRGFFVCLWAVGRCVRIDEENRRESGLPSVKLEKRINLIPNKPVEPVAHRVV